ncbi:Alpha/Beta hydrolase protein [Aspergillus keveii]|uniref:Alpha/Beta hydrolase protein n=1 Tax=Aspergillus keveii TaxID=714993 RepID=A0ABR4FIS9_9EURO
MPEFQVSTHVFKVVDGLSLSIDVSKPSSAPKNGVVLVHFHGGFLVLGEKTTFPPHWLINACHVRGWTYATPSYRLLPESTGLDILSDTLDAVNWVRQSISDRVIIAGSSAGGYLAFATAAHPSCLRPLAVLSVYGMLDPASDRYIRPGQALVAPVENLSTTLQEIDAATKDGQVLDGYPFPATPATDKRHGWIRALHEGARYPDVLTRTPGLAEQIVDNGVSVVPEKFRPLFPLSFGLKEEFPPTVLLHGDADVLVGIEQSAAAAEKMVSIGIDVHLERVPGQGHGFDAKTFIELNAGDAQCDDVATRNSLRRVVRTLEKACS